MFLTCTGRVAPVEATLRLTSFSRNSVRLDAGVGQQQRRLQLLVQRVVDGARR
jgi:hypothetical protein